MRFFHGSYNEDLYEGQILEGRGDDYVKDWGDNDFYQILEKYRPEHMLAHKDSVFLCAHPDDVDRAGGGTTIMCEVEVLGDITRHDLNWATEISSLSSFNETREEEFKRCAENYWNGVPYDPETGVEPVWEYKTNKGKILSVEEFDTAFLDQDIPLEYSDEEFNNFKKTINNKPKKKI